MAKVLKKRRPFYVVKITLNRLFGDSGKYFDDADVKRIKRINMLKRFKRRCNKLYDELFDGMDTYYRESVKFVYTTDGWEKKNRKNMVLVDFYTHRLDQERAKENTYYFKKANGSFSTTNRIFTGEILFIETDWYKLKIHQQHRINKIGRRYQKLMDKEIKILNSCKVKNLLKKS